MKESYGREGRSRRETDGGGGNLLLIKVPVEAHSSQKKESSVEEKELITEASSSRMSMRVAEKKVRKRSGWIQVNHVKKGRAEEI